MKKLIVVVLITFFAVSLPVTSEGQKNQITKPKKGADAINKPRGRSSNGNKTTKEDRGFYFLIEDGDGIVLVFESDFTGLNEEHKRGLDYYAKTILGSPNNAFLIAIGDNIMEGQTYEEGIAEFKTKLAAIRNYLLALGVPESQLDFVRDTTLSNYIKSFYEDLYNKHNRLNVEDWYFPPMVKIIIRD